MSDYKIPKSELTGEENLKGTYRVTFLVDISEDDQMSIDDLHQSIASSVSGDPVLYKIAKLDLEKTDNQGNALPAAAQHRVGDLVIVINDTHVEAKIEIYNGHAIVGAKNLVTEQAGEGILVIPAGTKARINKINGNDVELVDFDSTMSASLRNAETDEFSDISVNVDSVIFSNKYIAQVAEDDENLWP